MVQSQAEREQVQLFPLDWTFNDFALVQEGFVVLTPGKVEARSDKGKGEKRQLWHFLMCLFYWQAYVG
jgi:hypothetical protein